MNHNFSVFDAMEVIETYGADDVFWPEEHVDDIKAMLDTDKELRNLYEDAKWLEEMLSNWEESDDDNAVQINLDDLDDDAPLGDSFGNQDKDNDEPEASEPDDQQDEPDEPDDEEPSDDEDESEEEYDGPPLDVDAEDVKDMDEMLSEFIREQIEILDPTEFRVFTRDYDGLVDVKVADGTELEEIEQKVALSTGPLQKDLRRMIASRSQVQRLPGKRSGRLHAPNLHRILAGDDRVFSRRVEAPSLDTAISLMIDFSGSMSGTRLQLATEAAYAIATVLSRLNVPFECLGFTDYSMDPRVQSREYADEVEAADQIARVIRAVPLIIPKLKTFEERWTHPVQKRFAMVREVSKSPFARDDMGFKLGSTPEGCGLEFVARRLLQRKEQRKILISMTDGEPGGHTYYSSRMCPADYEAYANQSKKVVKSIEAAGIDLVGVGIEHDGPKGYYTNSMVIHELEEMPKQLLNLLRGFMVG